MEEELVTPDGFLKEIWAVNRKQEIVHPHLIHGEGGHTRGFAITLTGKREDYQHVSLERFLDHIANGDFEKVGRVRMKVPGGTQSNGFAVRWAMMSEAMREELDRRARFR